MVAAVTLLAGCQVTRTQHDDIRSTCVAAANAHQFMTSRALAGKMSVDAFVAADEAWDEIAASCKTALRGEPVSPASEGNIREFNARYGRYSVDAER